MKRTILILAVAMFGLVVTAWAGGKVKKHHHHSGHDLAALKGKKDGTHQLHKNGKHTVSADVKGGKIAAIHVKHETKGDVAVKKYKSKKKYASLENTSDVQPADAVDAGEVWIAYAYVDDDGNEEYYWFPYEEIVDGDTGAVDYVPLS